MDIHPPPHPLAHPSSLPPLPPPPPPQSSLPPATPAAPATAPAPPQANGAPPPAPAAPALALSDAALDRELPTVVQDLVPLAYVVDRVVASAYSDLANLVETLPSQPDQSRKRAIVDYVLHTRRQLVKLLVLTRWSTEAERVGKAMNIIGFLSSQNHLLTTALTSLTQTSTLLPGARVRNYDLPTSLSVLTSGDYPALPSVVRDEFAAQEKMSAEEVVKVMREVEDGVRWRLVMGREWVPRGMRGAPYRIADGRVTFSVPGLWEASFTYSGNGSSSSSEDDEESDEEDESDEGSKNKKENETAAGTAPDAGAAKVPAEWFLLSLRFLFRVKDARGVPYHPTPAGPLKDHLIDLCNRELVRRPFLPAPFQAQPQPQPQPAAAAGVAAGEGAGEGEGEGKDKEEREKDPQEEQEEEEKRREEYDLERREIVRKRRRDRPLGRAYTFIQRLALSYQLEAVAAQAAKLAATGWSGSLRVERRRAGAAVGAANAKGKGKEKEKEGEEGMGEEVRVEYWTHKPESAPPKPSAANAAASRPTVGGTLVFSLRPPSLPPSPSTAAARPPLSSSLRTAAREEALQVALAAGSYTSPSRAPPSSSSSSTITALPNGLVRLTSSTPALARGPSATPAPGTAAAAAARPLPAADQSIEDEPDVPPSLLVTWLPTSSSASVSTSYLYPSTPTTLTLRTPEEAMDVEKVLRRVTRMHARDTVRRLGEEVGGAGRVVWPRRRRGRGGDGQEEEGDESDEEEEDDEVAKEEEEDVQVPYLLFPLYPSASHAVGAFIDPLTGRFELRAVAPPPSLSTSSLLPSSSSSLTSLPGSSVAAALEPSAARDQRLRVASERIDRERFSPLPAPPHGAVGVSEEERARGWMRSVGDVVGRIRASTILDDLDTLALLLSLPPPTRRLPVPPRELAKFGPAFASAQAVQSGRNGALFVPLQHTSAAGGEGGSAGAAGGAGGGKGGLDGFWLAMVLVADAGAAGAVDTEGEGNGSRLRPALLRTREASDGATTWLEVAEVGWISLPLASSPSSSSPSSTAVATSTAISTFYLPPSPSPQTFLSVWRYAVHRASLFKVEEALRARRVPFRVVFPPAPPPSASASTSTPAMAAEQQKPYLVVPASALVRAPAAQTGGGVGKKGVDGAAGGGGEVAFPNAAIQCVVDEDGAVRTTLHARFRFPLSSASDARPDPAQLPPNVLYSPKQDVVVFVAEGELEGQVERLLRAYATVSRAVLHAQQNAPALPPSSASKNPSSAPSASLSATAGKASKQQQKQPPPSEAKSALKIVNGVGVKPFG
ncbi:hypothetical protein JCM6882_006500 [Rhodosporidiobolus microsporus]